MLGSTEIDGSSLIDIDLDINLDTSISIRN